MPAPAFEQAVATAIADHLDVRAKGHRVLRQVGTANADTSSRLVKAFAGTIRDRGASAIAPIIASGAISAEKLRISLDRDALNQVLDFSDEELDPAMLEFSTEFNCRRRGAETKIIAGERHPVPDTTLIRALRNAHRWADMLKAGRPSQAHRSARKNVRKLRRADHSVIDALAPHPGSSYQGNTAR